MNKKFSVTATLLLAVALTAGCGSNNASSNNNAKSSNASQSSHVEKNKSTDKSDSATNKSQAPRGSRLAQMNRNLRNALPGTVLPENDGLGAGSDKLNVRYTKNGNTTNIYYSVGSTAKSFNDPSVARELPFAVLTETSNLSADQIKAAINYQAPATGLPTININGQQATEQGGAGQRYLQWNSGKWSYTIHASSVNGQDPIPTAKQILALSKKYPLPNTQTNSSVLVNVGYSYGSLNTIISWQQNDKLYVIKAHSPETAFKMLVSLK